MTHPHPHPGRHRQTGSDHRVARRGALGMLVTAIVCLLAGRTLIAAPLPAEPVALLAYAALALLTAGTAWLSLLLALSTLSTLPGGAGRAAHRLLKAAAPRTVGGILTVLLGTGLAVPQLSAPVTAPALAASRSAPAAGGTGHAAPGPAHPAPAFGDQRGEALPSAGWTPPAPARPVLPTAHPRLLGGGGGSASGLTVRSGDTLWDIVARHLGGHAAPAAIVAQLPRWHAANRDVIGPDPQLIRPGQVLVPPAPAR